VSVKIDHLGLPATDAQASARWLAEILDLDPPVADGPNGDMFNVSLGDSASILFVTDPAVVGHHVAFAVSETEFSEIVDRLRTRSIPFGNEPEDPANGQTADPLGGKGRVYFLDPNGHFFEVTCS
jgi:catechol 2,3-dioxygenase-like lactoylglutathione lyase family enzyme